VQSTSTSPAQYRAELPDDRRPDVEAVLGVVRRAIRPGSEERMSFGMFGWVDPLSTYSDTYNGSPLTSAGLAMQKRHNAPYLMCVYADAATERDFRTRWTVGGRRLGVGKSCLRYRRATVLAMDLLAEAVARFDAHELIDLHERSRTR